MADSNPYYDESSNEGGGGGGNVDLSNYPKKTEVKDFDGIKEYDGNVAGEADYIYIDEVRNKGYIWNGSEYVCVLGEEIHSYIIKRASISKGQPPTPIEAPKSKKGAIAIVELKDKTVEYWEKISNANWSLATTMKRDPMTWIIPRDSSIEDIAPTTAELGTYPITGDFVDVILQFQDGTFYGKEIWKYSAGNAWIKIDFIGTHGYMKTYILDANDTVRFGAFTRVHTIARTNTNINLPNNSFAGHGQDPQQLKDGEKITIEKIDKDNTLTILYNSSTLETIEDGYHGTVTYMYAQDSTTWNKIEDSMRRDESSILDSIVNNPNPTDQDNGVVTGLLFSGSGSIDNRGVGYYYIDGINNKAPMLFPQNEQGVNGHSFLVVKATDKDRACRIIRNISLYKRSFITTFWSKMGSTLTYFLGNIRPSYSLNYGLHIGWRTNSKFTVAFYANDVNWNIDRTPFVNKWVHYAIYHDTTSRKNKLWINGEYKGTETHSQGQYLSTVTSLGGARELYKADVEYSHLRIIYRNAVNTSLTSDYHRIMGEIYRTEKAVFKGL